MASTRTLTAVGLCVVVAVRASACPALRAVDSIGQIGTLGFNNCGLRALVGSACIDVCRGTPQQQHQQVPQGQMGRTGQEHIQSECVSNGHC